MRVTMEQQKPGPRMVVRLGYRDVLGPEGMAKAIADTWAEWGKIQWGQVHWELRDGCATFAVEFSLLEAADKPATACVGIARYMIRKAVAMGLDHALPLQFKDGGPVLTADGRLAE